MAIRTKERVQFVRYNNNGAKLNHVLQQHAIQSAKSKRNKETSAESSATNDVQSTAASAYSESSYRLKRHISKQFEKRNDAKQEQINNTRNRQSIHSKKPEPVKAHKTNNKLTAINSRNSTINKAKQESANTVKDTFTYIVNKAETFIVSAFNAVKTGVMSSSNAVIIGIVSAAVVVIIVTASFFETGGGEALEEPNFYNLDAYVIKNPYAQSGLYGQCTWFAWGRFYELYGYSPGFTGDGWHCAEQLVEAHPDTWELSDTPTDLCVFSGVGVNHVGIVLYYRDGILTIQHGNMDGETNTFEEATKDWCQIEISLKDIQERYDGVIFAVPK